MNPTVLCAWEGLPYGYKEFVQLVLIPPAKNVCFPVNILFEFAFSDSLLEDLSLHDAAASHTLPELSHSYLLFILQVTAVPWSKMIYSSSLTKILLQECLNNSLSSGRSS